MNIRRYIHRLFYSRMDSFSYLQILTAIDEQKADQDR